MKKLSVIVPVYNMAADQKLDWCMNSLVHQTIPQEEYEIIAVDDCSTDSSYQILCEYQKQYPQLVRAYHSPENLHQGGAKNIGLTMAQGEWIGFIDADDWVTPDYYEQLLTRAQETGADMVGCDYHLTGEHSDRIGQIVHNGSPEQSGDLTPNKYRSLILDSGSLVVKIYRRYIVYGNEDRNPSVFTNASTDERVASPGSSSDTYEDAGDVFTHRLHIFPEKIFYEDNAVSNTWMLRAHHYEYIPRPLYYYYQHKTSTVHTITMKNLTDRMEAGREMLRQAKDGGYLEEYRPEVEYVFTQLFYVNTLFSAMPKQQKIPGCYTFTRRLGEEMKKTFPDFQQNPYYKKRIHTEEQKLIAMQMHSQLQFYVYYRLLWFWRGLRSR